MRSQVKYIQLLFIFFSKHQCRMPLNRHSWNIGMELSKSNAKHFDIANNSIFQHKSHPRANQTFEGAMRILMSCL